MEKKNFPAKLENLPDMLTFIKESAQSAGFDQKKMFDVQLACEEALVNVINYAYPGKEGTLEVSRAVLDTKGIEIIISDSGVAFDPLSLPMPDINAPLEERKIGGLGIYLMRKDMDSVAYRRENEMNILTLKKQ